MCNPAETLTTAMPTTVLDEVKPRRPAGATAIELRGVTVGYLTETVIRELSLSIGAGELTGIFGPNGAGKTTLLCAVNGLAVMRGGSVFVGGRRLTLRSGCTIRKLVGFVPQHFDIDPGLPISAREVVMMGRCGKLGLLRFPGRRERRLLEELTELLGIGHVIHKPFGQLSGGEKKRVLIARALMKEPRLLLLDEIFAWLDRDMETRLMRMIKEIHYERGLTTLMVSHDLKTIDEMCTRVVWMEAGEVIFDGGKDEFIRKAGE